MHSLSPFEFDEVVWDIYEGTTNYIRMSLAIGVLGELKLNIDSVFVYEHCGDVEAL